MFSMLSLLQLQPPTDLSKSDTSYEAAKNEGVRQEAREREIGKGWMTVMVCVCWVKTVEISGPELRLDLL